MYCVKGYPSADHVMVDINYQLKIVYENGRSNFFDNISHLKKVNEQEILTKHYIFWTHRVLHFILRSFYVLLFASYSWSENFQTILCFFFTFAPLTIWHFSYKFEFHFFFMWVYCDLFVTNQIWHCELIIVSKCTYF